MKLRGRLLFCGVVSAFLFTKAEARLAPAYPSNPVAILHVQAYEDGLNTIGLSTWTLTAENWDVLRDKYVWIDSSQTTAGYVTGWITNTSTRPWTVEISSWTIPEYTKLVADQARNNSMNDVMDDGVEPYMVFPATDTTRLIGTWSGFCSMIVGDKVIPVICP
jgi:hypothetical protein